MGVVKIANTNSPPRQEKILIGENCLCNFLLFESVLSNAREVCTTRHVQAQALVELLMNTSFVTILSLIKLVRKIYSRGARKETYISKSFINNGDEHAGKTSVN